LTRVMKFGGSSVRDAERMREVAEIVCSFPDQAPALVLSAMGKTTNNLLAAGEAALSVKPKEVGTIEPFIMLSELHLKTMDELKTDDETREDVVHLLEQLQQLLTGVCIMQELTPRMKANLVSYGERMSTRIFSSFLRSQGVRSKQCDAWEIGFVSTDDDFEAGEILPETYGKLREALIRKPGEDPYVPVVTGFLAKGIHTNAICTLGRGGSDLSATVIGAALDVDEVQVWKDVDGVLSADPRRIPSATPVPYLTFEEATELAYFGAQVLHPHAMRPAMDSDHLAVRVKNSYNIMAPGTLITSEREMEGCLLTSIVMKEGITLLDIVSTRMLGQYGFLSKVFEVMKNQKISVDVVATSEVSVSLTLDPAKFWSRELYQEEVDSLLHAFEGIAQVQVKKGYTILSLIGNVNGSSALLEKAFHALAVSNVNVIMMSKGASKVNLSLVVEEKDGERALQALHSEFFEGGVVSANGANHN